MWSSLFRSAPSRYPQQRCFFCGTESVVLPPYGPSASRAGDQDQHSAVASASDVLISTGSPSNWFCSACHCQNTLAADGTPADHYVRPMWDEAWNKDRSQLVPHTRPSSTRAPASSSPRPQSPFAKQGQMVFCHTCQTNQVLLLNMLADYLPDESHPDYERKLKQLPAYQASISARYPVACAQCAPKVQRCIQERDQFTRSWSLARWLELKQQASLSASKDAPASSATKPTTRFSRKKPAYGLHGTDASDDGRSLRAAAFSAATAAAWSTYLAATLYTSHTVAFLEDLARRLRSQPVLGLAVLVIVVVLLQLFYQASIFDPLQKRMARMRARSIRPDVHGRQLWRAMQALFFWTRSSVVLLVLARIGASILEAPLLKIIEDEGSWAKRLSLSLLVYEAVTLAVVGFRTRIVMPPELKLVSRPIVGAYEQTQRDMQQDDLLHHLTLNEDTDTLNGHAAHGHVSAEAEPFQALDADSLHQDADGDEVMEDLSQSRRLSHSSSDADIRAPNGHWLHSPRNPASVAYDFQLGPQKFWGPEKPTGLEDVFGNAIRLDDSAERAQTEVPSSSANNWSRWLGFA